MKQDGRKEERKVGAQAVDSVTGRVSEVKGMTVDEREGDRQRNSLSVGEVKCSQKVKGRH